MPLEKHEHAAARGIRQRAEGSFEDLGESYCQSDDPFSGRDTRSPPWAVLTAYPSVFRIIVTYNPGRVNLRCGVLFDKLSYLASVPAARIHLLNPTRIRD